MEPKLAARVIHALCISSPTCLCRLLPIMSLAPDATPDGELPPWEVAKAYAFHTVLAKAAEVLDIPAADLVGEHVADFIAKQVTLQGGGHPHPRSIRKLVARCQDPSWYPGKPSGAREGAGRPALYTEHVKDEIARVSMDLKRKLIRTTPRNVRIRLPQLTRNPETGKPMCDKTIHGVFSTRCYDETEDDPWIYLPCVSQDVLPSELLPRRVSACRHVLRITSATSWRSHVSIDPCYSLLAKTLERMEEQQVAALGKERWMSQGSRRKGPNCRGPNTVKTQKGAYVTRVDWTPIFSRGKVRIYVVDTEAARDDTRLPQKLADSVNLAKFVRHVLPAELEQMQAEHDWHDLPRVVVHDKASYMVTAQHERLQVGFAAALQESGFRSWVGADSAATTKWLVKKFGDVYVHETLIAHIRRLLDTDFVATKINESPPQFKQRMKRVEDHLNSDAFAAPNGTGLLGLAKELRSRCEEVIRRKGQRIPK